MQVQRRLTGKKGGLPVGGHAVFPRRRRCHYYMSPKMFSNASTSDRVALPKLRHTEKETVDERSASNFSSSVRVAAPIQIVSQSSMHLMHVIEHFICKPVPGEACDHRPQVKLHLDERECLRQEINCNVCNSLQPTARRNNRGTPCCQDSSRQPCMQTLELISRLLS